MRFLTTLPWILLLVFAAAAYWGLSHMQHQVESGLHAPEPIRNRPEAEELSKIQAPSTPSTKRVRPVSAEARFQQLQTDLEKAQPCEFAAEMSGEDADLPRLIATSESPIELRTLRQLMLEPARVRRFADKSDAAKFLEALYLSGLLEGKPAPARLDYNGALDLLSDLMTSDPQNGAYPFFRAAVRSKLHQSRDEIRDDLISAGVSSDFNSKILELNRKLYGWGLESANHYLVAMQIWMNFPIPSYMPVKTLIDSFLSDPDFVEKAYALGMLMMKRNTPPKRGLKEGVYFLALEYQYGLIIAKQAWQKMNPGKALPKELQGSYKDFKGGENSDRFLRASDLGDDGGGQKDCNPDELRALVDDESREFRDLESAAH